MDIDNAFFNTSDFELLKRKKLGEGTFGKVYVAKNINDHKLYAAKIIKTHGDFNGHDQMLLMKESIILKKLHHPGIIEFKGLNFQSFDDPSKLEPSIITEYIERGSLKKILDEEQKGLADVTWTATKKFILLLGITNAMKYLHQHGIMHRDLKPENILIDGNYYPHICDFGLSKCFAKSLSNSEYLTLTGQIGTPMYMAPELFTNEKHYSPTIDVYSFSMIAYEIVTGNVPFSELDNTITSVALGIMVSHGYRPVFPDFVPKKMQDLISRCWSGNIAERPSFDEIFNELSNDFTCLGEDVDEDEINEYLSMIDDTIKENKKDDSYQVNKELMAKINDLEKKNNELEQKLIESTKIIQEKIKENEKNLMNCTSSNQLFIDALHNLLGNSKERNIKSAFKNLKKSSEKGNSYSSYLLGLLYANGKFVEGDFDKAKFYFKLSSKQGNSAGYYGIAWHYSFGYGVKQDYSKSAKYYGKAAEQGNSDSMNNLGWFYYCGKGVKKNYSKALEYYQMAINQNNPYAYNNLASLYYNGEGVKKDYSKAVEYYKKAIEFGDSSAPLNLGFLFENGYGVEQNYSKAIEYYQKAIDMGNEDAFAYLENLHAIKRNWFIKMFNKLKFWWIF